MKFKICFLFFLLFSVSVYALETGIPSLRFFKLPSVVDGSAEKGLSGMSNPRKYSYLQTAEQSWAQVVDDLGNGIIMMLDTCTSGNLYSMSEIGHYRKRIMPNIKVIRLIEEGSNGPNKIPKLVKDSVSKCLARYDKAREKSDEARKRGDNPAGTSSADHFYNTFRQYRCPQMEFRRIHHAGYMSLYILANIEQLESGLLADWIRKDSPKHFVCRDMDIWLIDAFFRQGSQKALPSTKKHTALTKGLNIAATKSAKLAWDMFWDIRYRGELKVVSGDPKDIRKIQTLKIPRKLSVKLDERTKSKVVQNFFEYVGQRKSKKN